MLHHKAVCQDDCAAVWLHWTTAQYRLLDVVEGLHAVYSEFVEQDRICISQR